MPSLSVRHLCRRAVFRRALDRGSALLAISALATENIYVRIRPASGQRERLRIARILTVTAGLAALLIALSGETIYGSSNWPLRSEAPAC
ncbi:hypothetical protein HXX25_06450 [Hyphobacterium sp. CCMP332]|uniref:hypothetical protein n=1 Tax=Hyphobacterium sp. CCMP332 TaxID=2749086 RepID=UPI0016508E8A|nr:hypothetical protein [Hyphobacterium sp. CCMP332]QNL19003.1 hypothetical protein HXX25_06450 [Hyphobacterium sp. CCMP332]